MKRNTLLAMAVLCSIILIPNFVLAETPKGEVVYATGYPIFYNNGGDPATHAAGQGHKPLLPSGSRPEQSSGLELWNIEQTLPAKRFFS